jgi:hypothetical protein
MSKRNNISDGGGSGRKTQTRLWWWLWWGLTFGGSLESGALFCVGTFGRNLPCHFESVLSVIYFMVFFFIFLPSMRFAKIILQ